jgi:hypothetical protein
MLRIDHSFCAYSHMTAYLHVGAKIDLKLIDYNKIPKKFRKDGNIESDILEEFVKETYPGLEICWDYLFEDEDRTNYFLCFSGDSDEDKFYDGAYSMKNFDTIMDFAKSEDGVKLFEGAMKKLNQKFNMKFYVFPIVNPDY